jgi:hypothetical protein
MKGKVKLISLDKTLYFDIQKSMKAKLMKNNQIGDIFECKINEPEIRPRNLKEHRLYWVLLNWLQSNTPDYIGKIFSLSVEAWHEILKKKFMINSIAFCNMPEHEFKQYFEDCITWLSTFIFKCKENDLIEAVRDHADIKRRI